MTQAPQEPEQQDEVLALMDARAEARPTFDFSPQFNGLLKPIHIKMRVATKGEQDAAALAAHAYVSELAKKNGVDPEVAQADKDITRDAKTCHLLFQVCRKFDDPKYPAFLGPKWMMDRMSADELAVLINFYLEVLRKTGTIDLDLSPERVDALARRLDATADTDAPNDVLVKLNRECVVEFAIRLAVAYCAKCTTPASNSAA